MIPVQDYPLQCAASKPTLLGDLAEQIIQTALEVSEKSCAIRTALFKATNGCGESAKETTTDCLETRLEKALGILNLANNTLRETVARL